MNDRPDFDPEKTFETIRGQWKKESYLSLPSKLESRLTLIEEQLSTLFQFLEKLLHDALDQTIDSDVNSSKFREVDNRLINLEAAFAILRKEVDSL
jgi:hypothetical protein